MSTKLLDEQVRLKYGPDNFDFTGRIMYYGEDMYLEISYTLERNCAIPLLGLFLPTIKTEKTQWRHESDFYFLPIYEEVIYNCEGK